MCRALKATTPELYSGTIFCFCLPLKLTDVPEKYLCLWCLYLHWWPQWTRQFTNLPEVKLKRSRTFHHKSTRTDAFHQTAACVSTVDPPTLEKLLSTELLLFVFYIPFNLKKRTKKQVNWTEHISKLNLFHLFFSILIFQLHISFKKRAKKIKKNWDSMKQQCWCLQKLVLKKVEPCPSSDFIFVFLFIVPTMERVLLRSSCPRSQMVKKIRRICVHWLIIYIVVLHRNWLIHINVLCPDMMNHSLAYCKSAYFCMLQTGDVYCES